MLPDSVPPSFIESNAEEVESYRKSNPNVSIKADQTYWSFSSEWEHHTENEMERTWGWSTGERYGMFLLETDSTEENLSKSIVVDAGCGNGFLTTRISKNAQKTIGIDYSDSVFSAEKNRIDSSLCFIKGDLQNPPFSDESLDIIFSSGVIHHTPNTKNTFDTLSKCIKKNGKFYVWLYSDKGSITWRIKRKLFDFGRIIVCRLNAKWQKRIVNLFTSILAPMNPKIDKQQLEIAMYDSLTPRWRYYHTPEEVSHWYHEEGFGPILVTHFDSKYGFGVVARKTGKTKTPGDHYSDYDRL